MLKIGVIVGREWSWPPAFIEEVNERKAGVIAEFAKLGGTRMNEPCEYAVIVDRISHEVPYYRTYLKNAVLQGTYVVNNPFMWSADDKFFEASLATKLGIPSPRTVVLPNKDYVPGIVHSESLRNLVYPVPWAEHVEYLGGFPVVLKDAHGGGWKNVYVVHSMDELFARYNESGLATMILQEHQVGQLRALHVHRARGDLRRQMRSHQPPLRQARFAAGSARSHCARLASVDARARLRHEHHRVGDPRRCALRD